MACGAIDGWSQKYIDINVRFCQPIIIAGMKKENPQKIPKSCLRRETLLVRHKRYLNAVT